MDTVLLVHGFAGTAGSWDGVIRHLDRERYLPLAAELRGHGQNGASRPITTQLCVDDLLAAAPPTFTLVGYSLGGRIALALALSAPERIERLVLLSANAGIDDGAQRSVRLARDLALADQIEAGSIEQFADLWLAGPLFCDDRAEVNDGARAEIEKNSPHNLAAALRALSVGRLEPLWRRLAQISVPTTVVAGELDAQYCSLAERLSAAIGGAELELIAGVGHALPRNAPEQVAALL